MSVTQASHQKSSTQPTGRLAATGGIAAKRHYFVISARLRSLSGRNRAEIAVLEATQVTGYPEEQLPS
jgi:hypothetical protein